MDSGLIQGILSRCPSERSRISRATSKFGDREFGDCQRWRKEKVMSFRAKYTKRRYHRRRYAGGGVSSLKFVTTRGRLFSVENSGDPRVTLSFISSNSMIVL